MIAVSLADGSQEELITTEVAGTQEYPSWSPDGSHIAFTLKQGARSDINAIRLKDKKLVKITNSGKAEQSKWSNF
jgi:Tol biopolymer transport system component